jgi:hypothetical protein
MLGVCDMSEFSSRLARTLAHRTTAKVAPVTRWWLCMRDAKTEMMSGRFGLSAGVEQFIKTFKSHLKTTLNK